MSNRRPLNYSFQELETFVKEQARIQAAEQEIHLQQQLKSQNRKAAHLHACAKQAEALRLQISLNQAQRQAGERYRKSPGINPSFNGYPNIPRSSYSRKRDHKRNLQGQLRRDLEAQIQDRRKKLRQEALLSIQFDKAVNEKTQAELQAEKLRNVKKKERIREELWKAKEAAEKNKAWLQKLDREEQSMETTVDVLVVQPSPSSLSSRSSSRSPTPHFTLPEAASLQTASVPVLPPVQPHSHSNSFGSPPTPAKSLSLAVPHPVISTVKTLHLSHQRRPAYAITISQPRLGSQMF